MPSARSAPRCRQRLALLLPLAVLLAGLLGLQGWLPAPAQAAVTGPTAVDDTVTSHLGDVFPLAGASNDLPGSAAIEPSLTVFPTGQLSSLPNNSKIDEQGRRLQVVGHGTFEVTGSDGSVTFTPWSGLTGTVTVRYRITDANGATDDGLLTVVVTAGGGKDVASTYVDLDRTVDLLANDVPGRNANGTPGTIDRTSARFPVAENPHGTVSEDGLTYTDPDLGVLTISSRGVLTLHPTATAQRSDSVSYTAQDTTSAAGGTEHHAYVSSIRVTISPNYVSPGADVLDTPYGTSLRLPGLLNDRDTNPAWKLLPELSRFDEDVDDHFPGTTVSADRRQLTRVGKGTLTINPDGSVTFVPVPGFVGEAGAAMSVFDDHGNRGQESEVATVLPGPKAVADRGTTTQNVATAVAVLANDVPGKEPNAKSGVMDATYVRFLTDGQPEGAVVSGYQRTLTVPGQGVYTVDPTTGTISFDPEASFVGTAGPVAYKTRDTVVDRTGAVVHNPTSSTLTIAVGALTPVALNNWSNTTVGRAVAVPVLGNDRPGAASAPLVPSSVRLRLGSGLPSSSTLSADGRTLTIPGRGTYAARADGVVVVTPAAGFAGVVPTVGYTVSDTNGTSASATVTVGVARASS